MFLYEQVLNRLSAVAEDWRQHLLYVTKREAGLNLYVNMRSSIVRSIPIVRHYMSRRVTHTYYYAFSDMFPKYQLYDNISQAGCL